MLHKVMYPDDAFKASQGWLHRFKQRHGISLCQLIQLSEYIEEKATKPAPDI